MYMVAAALIVLVSPVQGQEAYEREDIRFRIRRFEISGNTILTEDKLREELDDFVGRGKTVEDIELARQWLENVYTEMGYLTVLVTVPEQTVENGVVRLDVIERKIRKVKITGNRYYTMEKILADLPSLNPGELFYMPKVKEDLAWINSKRDIVVAPYLRESPLPDRVDLELKVKDHLPLHGSLEINNRNSPETTDLRLNASIGYHNLWQKEHAFVLQYQTSPEDFDEVQVVAASYTLPAPWVPEHMLAFYGIASDSDTAFGEGFEVLGKGFMLGARLVLPLPEYKSYQHNLTAGVDYKDFEETIGFEDGEEVVTPIAYLPFSLAYSSSLPDAYGTNLFSLGINLAFRGLVTDQEDFEQKRFKSRGDYLYATLGWERYQPLPAEWLIYAKLDGQAASQPLISNEQYIAGGMESVRGYYESEESGDNALHGTFELQKRGLSKLIALSDMWRLSTFVFFDFAELWLNDALPQEDDRTSIQGGGFGIRGGYRQRFDFEVDWGLALSDGSDGNTESGDSRIHFKVQYRF